MLLRQETVAAVYLIIAATNVVGFSNYYDRERNKDRDRDMYRDPDNIYRDRSNRLRHTKVVACYLNSTNFFSPERRHFSNINNFDIRNVREAGCTHLIYGAAEINPSTLRVKSSYGEMEQDGMIGKMTYKQIRDELKYDVKVVLSIGGRSADFSAMSRDESMRKNFVSSVINFIQKFDFDGINIDWQYPGRNRGDDFDRENFLSLIMDLKKELRQHGKTLSIFVPHDKNTIRHYDLSELWQYLDFLYILAFEYHGSWDYRVFPNAPLRSRDSLENVDSTVQYYLNANVPAYKLVLGVPFYGKTYHLKMPLQKQSDSPMGQQISSGRFSYGDEIAYYNKICKEITNERHWRTGWDRESGTPYAVYGDKVIVYESPESVTAKTNYATRNGLAGIMAYSIEMDDFNGDCAGYHSNDDYASSKYPLISAINYALERGPNSASLQSCSITLVSIFALILMKFVF